jgi:acetolactate synthase I/II/III large subunit
MKVSEAIARAFQAEGDAPIFSLMGNGTLNLIVQMDQLGATVVNVRHEAAAVAAADGFARVSGEVGVAAVTCGPGLTQVGTSLVAANRNGSPIILVTGGLHVRPGMRGQELDQRRFAEACEALFQPVQRMESVAEDVRDAFYTARTRRRPVVLEVPVDLQLRELDYEWQYRPSSDFTPSLQRPIPEATSVSAAAATIRRAKRPLIIAGQGAVRSDARVDIIALADKIGALLGTTLPAKGWFDGHAWDIGVIGAMSSAPAEGVLIEADLVIAIGCELGHHTTEGGFLFPEADVIRIDIQPSPDLIGPVTGTYLQGDARESVVAITLALDSDDGAADGFRTPAVRERLATPPPPHDPVSEVSGLDPREVMRRLSGLLPERARVFCGIGHYWAFPVQYLSLRPDVDIRFVHQFSAIGQTLPTAIGAAFAERDRPIVVLEGDGSVMMQIQELDTVNRYDIDLSVIIINDAGFGAEVHMLDAKGNDSQLGKYRSPDFAALAVGMGGTGVRIDRIDQLEPALRSMSQAKIRPFVIDLRVAPVISDPVRRLYFGLDSRAPRLPILGSNG